MSDAVKTERWVQSAQADGTLAGDRAAIYHRETRKAVTLNSVGTVLWQALEVPRSRAELAGEITTRWPQVEQARAEADVDRFLEELRGHQLIVVA